VKRDGLAIGEKARENEGEKMGKKMDHKRKENGMIRLKKRRVFPDRLGLQGLPECGLAQASSYQPFLQSKLKFCEDKSRVRSISTAVKF
jgi:hypothetical protein